MVPQGGQEWFLGLGETSAWREGPSRRHGGRWSLPSPRGFCSSAAPLRPLLPFPDSLRLAPKEPHLCSQPETLANSSLAGLGGVPGPLAHRVGD
ncbi:hypothetical protein Cadr_000001278 [Camelus dromedarius]|uniref:Uncharacterized protein n=1 Tax=Camelus dromedarius TaxID=9838 RepID=A0A5N4EI36_CAMDR|nr:hypothetical protein Cadr_000001278 [Camelus dromedarius]